MSLQKEAKIKQLYRLLPEGVVAPSSWLVSNGYSAQLLHRYVKSGWLTKVGRGAYLRPASVLEWQGVVLGLQRLANLPFHVGGISALNLSGYAHYLPVTGDEAIALYGTKNPPAWTQQIKSPVLFFEIKPILGTLGLIAYPTSIRDWEITISSPERAMLELLYQVDDTGITFQYASEIFESMTTLRPKLLNNLLQHCKSRKVKRLFLFFADHYNFAWTKHIDKTIDMGEGKLQIAKEGHYDSTYMITVPKGFDD